MSNVTFTSKEVQVLQGLYGAVENVHTQAGAKWGTVYLDNADTGELTQRSVAGILGSLGKKGCYVDNGECFGSVKMGLLEEETPAEPVAVESVEVDHGPTLEIALGQALGSVKSPRAALRKVAKAHAEVTEEPFVAAAVKAGVTEKTARAQFKKARG